MSTILLVWYSLGWSNVAFACRYKLRSLTTCQLGFFLAVLPLVELLALFLAFLAVRTAVEDPLYAIGAAILGVSYAAAGFMALAALWMVMDWMEGACRIIWKKP